MSRDSARPAFIAGGIVFSVMTFAAGAASTTVFAGDAARGEPIIHADAWAEQPPDAIVPVASAEATTVECSPWAVSDVAMEEILLEMQRRGWRAPNQGDALALLDASGERSASATYPDAPMPQGYGGQSGIVIEADMVQPLPVEATPLVGPEVSLPLPPTN